MKTKTKKVVISLLLIGLVMSITASADYGYVTNTASSTDGNKTSSTINKTNGTGNKINTTGNVTQTFTTINMSGNKTTNDTEKNKTNIVDLTPVPTVQKTVEVTKTVEKETKPQKTGVPESTPVSTTAPKTPGFGIIAGIIGLLSMVYMLRKR